MTDTLSFCGREEAITRMNCFGSKGRPFFFLIDYIGEKCLVEEPVCFSGSHERAARNACHSASPLFSLGALSDEF